MENPVYHEAVQALSNIYGPLLPDGSPDGVCTTTSPAGNVMILHAGVAPGNFAEIVFDVDSLSQRMAITRESGIELFERLARQTGRPVNGDRGEHCKCVGISDTDQIPEIVTALVAFFGP